MLERLGQIIEMGQRAAKGNETRFGLLRLMEFTQTPVQNTPSVREHLWKLTAN